MKFEFSAPLLKHQGMDAAYIEIPFDVEKTFGKKRVKVKVTFDGILYRGTIVRMGSPCYWIGVTQEIRKKTGKNPGDQVNVVLEPDTEDRIVDIPADLRDVFSKFSTEAVFFSTLSYSNRKEYVRWITEAKKTETRNARLKKIVELLKGKKKNPSSH